MKMTGGEPPKTVARSGSEDDVSELSDVLT
jgi:hypothetical protein